MSDKTFRLSDLALPLAVALGILLGFASGDGGSPGSPSDQETEAAPSFNTSLDMQQLMALVLEPAAEVLWDSAGWVLDRDEGYQELYPTSDEEWDAVLSHAAVVVETGNLLSLPGRAEDADAWMIYADGLSQAGLLAMEAVAARDNEAFFQAGARIYSVCTACHQAYSPEINSRFVIDTEE